jgi:hypothetical protein
MNSAKEEDATHERGDPGWLVALRAKLNVLPIWVIWILCFGLFFAVRVLFRLITRSEQPLPSVDDVTVDALVSAVFSVLQGLYRKAP